MDDLHNVNNMIEKIIEKNKNKSAIIGIDPGKDGGIFALVSDISTNNVEVIMYTMPKLGDIIDLKTLNSYLKELNVYDCLVFLEDVHAIYGSSAKGTFNFGWNLGILEGQLTSNKMPYRKIAPKIWQSKLFQGIKEQKDSKGKTQTKLMALNAVQNILPDVNFIVGNRSRKPHEGIVDAACLALYGKMFQK